MEFFTLLAKWSIGILFVIGLFKKGRRENILKSYGYEDAQTKLRKFDYWYMIVSNVLAGVFVFSLIVVWALS